MRSGGSLNTAPTMTKTTKETFSPPETITVQRSPWHSPLPYLFGGLAAMLGLIAFALLILACSYWRLSGRSDNGESGEADLEADEDKPGDAGKALPVFEEKILVIMAGNVKPTFLATPMMSIRASSFGGDDAKIKKEADKEREEAEVVEKRKQEMGHHDHTPITIEDTTESRETQENPETQ